jgi:hypothetical protein
MKKNSILIGAGAFAGVVLLMVYAIWWDANQHREYIEHEHESWDG